MKWREAHPSMPLVSFGSEVLEKKMKSLCIFSEMPAEIIFGTK
jgi:hypothetical protein